ncbi:hypothetical protein [Paraglaciecola chathamensis]|uniref:hypothetical protein n=1 Tax=Paraglaciecola chathamensis TaxID=368405 RepID=UPI003625D501
MKQEQIYVIIKGNGGMVKVPCTVPTSVRDMLEILAKQTLDKDYQKGQTPPKMEIRGK